MSDDMINGADAPPPETGAESDLDLMAEPPKWPKVVGIVSIVWAALSLACGGCGAVSMAFTPRLLGSQLQGADLPPSLQFGALQWIQMGLSLALAALLLVAGILTVSRQYAGRVLHLAYGACSLPVVLLGLYVQLERQAEYQRWVTENPDHPLVQQGMSANPGIMFIVGLLVGIVLGLGWPVFCLIWFGLVKRTRLDMTGVVPEPVS